MQPCHLNKFSHLEFLLQRIACRALLPACFGVFKYCSQLTHLFRTEEFSSLVNLCRKQEWVRPYTFKIWWGRFTTGVKTSTLQKTLCKENSGWVSLKQESLSRNPGREAFHSEVSEKFKCLSHVGYIAYTAVQAFLPDVCAHYYQKKYHADLPKSLSLNFHIRQETLSRYWRNIYSFANLKYIVNIGNALALLLTNNFITAD